jgi:hypothetical protein
MAMLKQVFDWLGEEEDHVPPLNLIGLRGLHASVGLLYL